MKTLGGMAAALLYLLSIFVCACAASEPAAAENACELQELATTMYCYCDYLELNQAEVGNCWIYDDTRQNDTLWDTFYHQPNLHRLTINLRGDGSLDYVPVRLLNYTRRLWVMEIRNAAIRRVHADAFAGSRSLSELVLTSNSMAHLAKHAFSDLTNLTRLNLGKNNVSVLGRHVFRNLPKLKQLYLDRNSLARIRNGAFASLDALQDLELYDNRLERVSQGTFRGLRRLQRLDLHRNLLETIEDDSFAAMPSLKELDLEENRIKYISERGLSGLRRLMRLNLHDNKLLSLLPGTFQDTPNVFYLDIHQNVLDTLEEESFAPILDNMRNITMYLFVQDNALRCDCRLGWLLRLRRQTASSHVQAALDGTVCHMESGTVPARLESAPTADPALETSTLGIGPPVRLTDLKVHELPCDGDLRAAIDPAPNEIAVEEEMQQQKQKSPLQAAAPAKQRDTPQGDAPVQRGSTADVTASGSAAAAGCHTLLLAWAAAALLR